MKQKQIGIVLGIIFVLIIGVVVVRYITQRTKKPEAQTQKNVLEEENIVPTVDSNTSVSLTYASQGKELLLKVSGIPHSTTSVEYVVSYETKQQGFQGVQGTITTDTEKTSIEKQFTLGTCSSGRCVYHEVVGALKLELKFTGSFGEKFFEKEYTL